MGPAERPLSPAYTPLPSSSLSRNVCQKDSTRIQVDNILNAEERVVLRDTLAARGRTSLDLADTEGDDEVSDESVLSLTTAVRDHDSPVVGLRKLGTVAGSHTHALQEISGTIS